MNRELHDAVCHHLLFGLMTEGGHVDVFGEFGDTDRLLRFDLPAQLFRFRRSIPGTTTLQWRPAPAIAERAGRVRRAALVMRDGAAFFPLTAGGPGSGAQVRFDWCAIVLGEPVPMPDGFSFAVEWIQAQGLQRKFL